MTDFLYPMTFTKRFQSKNLKLNLNRSLIYPVYCNANKDKIIDIMNIMLVKYCRVDVCGYNKEINEYWGKKIKKNICELHFSISIMETQPNKSTVLIKVNVGSNETIETLLENVIDAIRSCED